MNSRQARSAAALLLLLDEEQGAALLRDLDGTEVEAIATEMLRLEVVEPAEIGLAAAEFLRVADRQGDLGPVTGADQLLRRAVGGDHAALLTARLATPTPQSRVPSLQWFDAPTLAEALSDIHPQMAAAILAVAPPALAVAALQRLPTDAQPDVIRKIAAMRELGGAALDDIEVFLAAVITKHAARDRHNPGGAAAAGRLLSQANRSSQARWLTALQSADPELSASLSENLFMFEDVVALDSRSLQLVLREIDSDILTVALRGSDDRTRDTLLAGLSQRTAAAIRDDLSSPSTARIAEIQSARKEVVATTRRLADSGVIEIGRDDDDN